MSEFDPEDTRWDPGSGLSYAEWLRSKSVGTPRLGDSISETTPHGHVITRHRDGRQDVTVNL